MATELKKQTSLFLPVSDWRIVQHEAARQKIPMTELCRRWIEPELKKLRRRQPVCVFDEED